MDDSMISSRELRQLRSMLELDSDVVDLDLGLDWLSQVYYEIAQQPQYGKVLVPYEYFCQFCEQGFTANQNKMIIHLYSKNYVWMTVIELNSVCNLLIVDQVEN